jgi:hypothetical protein
MYKSKSVSFITPKAQPGVRASNLGLNPRQPTSRQDPFFGLKINGSGKLLPVSPCGLRLPSLKTEAHCKKASVDYKFILCQTPRCEIMFKPNRVKIIQKETVPKTPYFKFRRKDPALMPKEAQSVRNRNSEINLQDLSFNLYS